MPTDSSTLVLLDRIIGEVSSGEVAPSTKSSKPALKEKQQQQHKPSGGKGKGGEKADAPPTAAKPPVAQAKAAAAPQAKAAAAKAAEQTTSKPAVTAGPSPFAGLPATKALYQQDTYLFTNEATVLAIQPPAEKTGWVVVLDETCFHPQGGGQPADTGTIAAGSSSFAVSMVKKDPSGVVLHEGPTEPPAVIAVGSKVVCTVDEKGRVFNARVHSAGHLIDVAMTKSGMAEKLRPTKGYHVRRCSFTRATSGFSALRYLPMPAVHLKGTRWSSPLSAVHAGRLRRV